MSQPVVSLPVAFERPPAPEPVFSHCLVETLPPGDRFLIWTIRRWHLTILRKEDSLKVLRDACGMIRSESLAPLTEEFLSLLSMSAFRPVQVGCLCKTQLTWDEVTLLDSLRLLQRNRQGAARARLERFVSPRLIASVLRSGSALAQGCRHTPCGSLRGPALTLASGGTAPRSFLAARNNS